MAQAGMYVPCSSFKFKPYKSLYTRILGNDNIFKGLSSFAVEMSELKSILKYADQNSLILGDELCRGTEFNSAIRIFLSGLIMLNKKGCSHIFATHFHEITKMRNIKKIERLVMKHMAVEFNRELKTLIYNRKLEDGPGTNNYGLMVCRSLGLPEEFIELAESIEMDVQLFWYDILFQDNFVDLENWEIVLGDWTIENGSLLSQQDLIYQNFSPPGPNRINSINFESSNETEAILELSMKYEIEWDNDTLFFDISNSLDSSRIFSFFDQNWNQKNYYNNLSLDTSSNNNLSLGIVSDITIGYRGLELDNLKVLCKPLDECQIGDLDHNSEVLITDIVILLHIILDNDTATGFQECSGDQNGDNNLDILDIVGIVLTILGE